MLSWEIFGDDLLWIEIYAGVALLLAAAVWAFVPKIPIGLVALVITIATLAVGAFRPFTYNSDTSNYYSYVYYLRFVTGREIFFLTKLEPLHSALILVLRDFRLWLITEAAIEVFGLVLCYKAKPNPHSFIILCAFVLTLSTSSLRFCSALIYFYYFVSKQVVTLPRTVSMTLLLSLIHISMLLSGAMALQKRTAPIAVSLLCLAIFFESSFFLGARVEVDFSEASRGLKSLAIAVVPVLYLIGRQQLSKSAYLGLYLVSLLAIFVISSTVLPTFNRYLILGTLTIMAAQWTAVRGRDDDVFDRGAALLVACGIVVPYVLVLPNLYYSGMW